VNRLGLALTIALRELHGGAKGFWLFLACLAIGVAAIAASGSMAQAFRLGLEAEQRTILGGDLSLNRRLSMPGEAERAFLEARGRTSLAVSARTMGSKAGIRRLIDLRAVDGAHPLEGSVSLSPASTSLQAALGRQGGLWGAVAEQALLDVFGLKVGDTLDLPYGTVRITAVLLKEPDALGRGFAFAPRLMISTGALDQMRLAQPGSLFSSSLRVVLRSGEDPQSVRTAFEAAFPDQKDNLRDRGRSAEGFGEALGQVELFLSCVGFAALLAGGLGVSGAVRGHMETRRTSIAVLKTLGASAADVRLAYGLQIGVLALLGSLAGALLGALAPFVVQAVYGANLPIPIRTAIFAAPVLVAVAIGLVCAFAFAAPPLGAARATAPTHLLRGGGALGGSPLAERLAGLGGLGLLAGVFAMTSPDPGLAILLALGTAAGWAAFWGMGRLAQLAAHRAPRPGGALGLALANLGGPGSLAPAAAPALGLGLALLAALGQLQSNLVTQVRETAPARAPSVAWTEIPDAGAQAFDRVVAQSVGRPLDEDSYTRTPVLTIRVLALNGRELTPYTVAPDERWFVEDEIGATWLSEQPKSATLTAGTWWPRGPGNPDPASAQVSLTSDVAEAISADVGDRLTVELSGREITARIANVREVDWVGFGPNFSVVFAPGPFQGAAFRHAAIARLTPEEEARVTSALATDFPAVGVIRVRDALAAAGDLFESLAVAIQAVAGVALAAGAAAIAGAMTAGARRRLFDAAILKSLGASRARILTAIVLEQAVAGLIAAVIGTSLGMAAAYAILTGPVEADWVANWPLVAGIVSAAVGGFALLGLVAGALALRRPPYEVLGEAAEFG
jgi:putative ABC transport system permease protein